jgi:putative phosphoribosyl transferase
VISSGAPHERYWESDMNIKTRLIYIPVGRAEIQGDLHIPDKSTAIVVFAHGSGSSRHSPRNKYVADVLNERGIATLLIDLLTPDEELIDFQTGRLRFDIDLLADRLTTVTHWLQGQSATAKLHVGYFGASTGAAAALLAAGKHPDLAEAIVSRGGRPDLAGPWLMNVRAPTLLIIGGDDKIVIDLNYQAAAELKTERRIEIVPNAGHLFEEPGALEKVAALARDWFEEHLILANRRAA